MNNIYFIFPLIINFIIFFILPMWMYIILSIITAIYFYIELKKNYKEKLNITISEYIFSIIILIIIIFTSHKVRYILISIESLIFARILVFNLTKNCGESNNQINTISKSINIDKSEDELEIMKETIKDIISESLYDLKIEISRDISSKFTEVENYVHKVSGNEKKNLDEVTGLVDNKIKEGLDNIIENIKETIESKNKNTAIDENYIKKIINKEIESNDIKGNFTNEVLEKIKNGTIDPYNTKQIKNEEIKKVFINTFKDAKSEIDIISPWISNWIFKDEELMNGFRIALSKGVNIKILYGIGHGSNFKYNYDDKRSIYTEENALRLEELFAQYKGTLTLKRGNTHEKILLCDDKYVLIGSYNLLSFNGDYKGHDIRGECMQYQENKNHIKKLRKEYFSF